MIPNDLLTNQYCYKNLILEDDSKRLYFGLFNFNNNDETKCTSQLAFILTDLDDNILSVYDLMSSHDDTYLRRAIFTHMIRFANISTKKKIKKAFIDKNDELRQLDLLNRNNGYFITYKDYLNDTAIPEIKVMSCGIIITIMHTSLIDMHRTNIFIPFDIGGRKAIDKLYKDLYDACVDMIWMCTKINIDNCFNNVSSYEYSVLRDDNYNHDILVKDISSSYNEYNIIIELFDYKANKTLSSVTLNSFNGYNKAQLLFYYMMDCAGYDARKIIDKYIDMDIFCKYGINKVYRDIVEEYIDHNKNTIMHYKDKKSDMYNIEIINDNHSTIFCVSKCTAVIARFYDIFRDMLSDYIGYNLHKELDL